MRSVLTSTVAALATIFSMAAGDTTNEPRDRSGWPDGTAENSNAADGGALAAAPHDRHLYSNYT